MIFKRIQFVSLFSLLCSTLLVSQIRVDRVGLVSYVSHEGEKMETYDQTKVGSNSYAPEIKVIMDAFQSFDFSGIKENWNPILKEELDVLEQALKSYEKHFEQAELIGVYHEREKLSPESSQCKVTFYSLAKDVKDLNILYGFKGEGNSIKINSVVVTHGEVIEYRFPQLYDKARIYLDNINIVDKQNDNLKKIAVYEEALSFFEINFSRLKNYLNRPNQTISNFYGSLAWFYNLANQGDKAITASQKGLTYHPANEWINTNLALGYVLNNQFELARPIYKKHINTNFRGGTLGSIFKQDLNDLESAGISIPQVKEVRALLKK